MPAEFPALKAALAELDAARKSLRDVFAEAGPDYDMSKVKSLSGETAEKLAWIRAKNEEIGDLKKRVDDLKAVANAADDLKAFDKDGARERGSGPGTDGVQGPVDIGRLFVKSAVFKGRVRGEVSSLPVDLKTLFQTTAGWAPESVRSGLVALSPQRMAPYVVNFIPNVPLGQPLYKFMEETTYTNAAAETAEGTAFPEAALALTERSRNVEKVSVWLPVTDEQLEDEPGAEAYVRQRLTLMIQQRLDLQVLAGNGASPNLLGTENVVGINTQALGVDTTLDAIYKLFTTIRETAFAEPSVLFIRPSKWQVVQLLKTADGMYIWGNPSQGGPMTVWGVPVGLTTAVNATKAVTGDYPTHSLLGIRRGIDVQITNTHGTHFTEGKQAIRADMRAVMVHIRPGAFGQVTGL